MASWLSVFFFVRCGTLDCKENTYKVVTALCSSRRVSLTGSVETIKSSAPFFTVMLTYFLLGQRTGWRVNFSLVPIGTGLVFCSLSDNSFHVLGFTAALMSNCTDCIQNVLTKRLLIRSYTYVELCLSAVVDY